MIQDALEKIMPERTCMVIGDRLFTICHANRIIVIHRREIREISSYAELVYQDETGMWPT